MPSHLLVPVAVAVRVGAVEMRGGIKEETTAPHRGTVIAATIVHAVDPVVGAGVAAAAETAMAAALQRATCWQRFLGTKERPARLWVATMPTGPHHIKDLCL